MFENGLVSISAVNAKSFKRIVNQIRRNKTLEGLMIDTFASINVFL